MAQADAAHQAELTAGSPFLQARWVGTPIKRREDPRLITGHGHYVDDVALSGMLHLAFVRSPYAHARLTGIDASRALTLPGVHAVLTSAETQKFLPALPPGRPFPAPPRYLLAVDKVRRVGEAVAVVVAETRYQAADAADEVQVDYDPLPGVSDPEAALEPGAAQLWDEFPGNCLVRDLSFGEGDVEAAFREADVTVSQRMTVPRLAPAAIETRGVAASYNAADGTLLCYATTQAPHRLRMMLCDLLGMREAQVHVIAPDMGGGFGAKGNLYPEETIACFLTRQLERPIKWIESRSESFTTTSHGRGLIGYVNLAAKRDGTITGLKLRIIADIGCTCDLITAAIPTTTARMVSNVYRIPAIKVTLTEALTNKTPTGPYRGAGRPEGVYFVERAVDLLADDLGLDPAEVRRRNFIPPEAFPFTTATGLVYDSGEYARALDLLLATADYPALLREQAAARAEGRVVGIGLSAYVETCGPGPSKQMGPSGGWEYGAVRVERTGAVTLMTGSSSHGQGHETSFAQLAADVLGVPPDKIDVLHGDTATVSQGVGTFGSRSTAVGGAALYLSLKKVEAKMRRIAAQMLEASEDDLVFADERIYPRDAPAKGLAFAQVTRYAYSPTELPEGEEPGLEASSYFEPTASTFPFGMYLCQVEIDRDTGKVELRRFVGVDDCGPIINPLLVRGQVHGGIAQGVGEALFEEVFYDAEAQLISGAFMDYGMPRADSLPPLRLEHTVTPTHRNPLGMKGVGEAGTIGSVPAIVNAVADALAPFGIRHVDMPLTPERVWAALNR